MFSEKEIFGIFRRRGFTYSGELFLSAPEASEFIRACEENNLSVIGMEGFTRENGAVRPRPDIIADYSGIREKTWPEFRKTCNRASADFLNRLDPEYGILINFTLFSEQEWLDRSAETGCPAGQISHYKAPQISGYEIPAL